MAYLKDISAVLGLSVSTVSRALKGYPDISEETRKRVMETAKELDYNYDSGRACKSAARVWGALGILAPDCADLIKMHDYRDLICGMAEETADSQRDLVIMGEETMGKGMSWVGRTETRRVDGICLLASRSDLYKGRFADLLESKVPVVSVGNDLAGHTSVCRDFRGDAAAILHYLKEKGHCKTAYFGDLSLDSRKHASILREEAQKLDMGFLNAEFGIIGIARLFIGRRREQYHVRPVLVSHGRPASGSGSGRRAACGSRRIYRSQLWRRAMIKAVGTI